MKYRHIILPVCFVMFSSLAQAGTLCAQKERAIQNEITHAEQHGNTHRVSGLKTALSEVQANCTDEKLIAEHQKKVKEHQEKVAERQAELKEAQEKGDPKKIAKRERKLAEAQSDLNALEQK